MRYHKKERFISSLLLIPICACIFMWCPTGLFMKLIFCCGANVVIPFTVGITSNILHLIKNKWNKKLEKKRFKQASKKITYSHKEPKPEIEPLRQIDYDLIEEKMKKSLSPIDVQQVHILIETIRVHEKLITIAKTKEELIQLKQTLTQKQFALQDLLEQYHIEEKDKSKKYQ